MRFRYKLEGLDRVGLKPGNAGWLITPISARRYTSVSSLQRGWRLEQVRRLGTGRAVAAILSNRMVPVAVRLRRQRGCRLRLRLEGPSPDAQTAGAPAGARPAGEKGRGTHRELATANTSLRDEIKQRSRVQSSWSRKKASWYLKLRSANACNWKSSGSTSNCSMPPRRRPGGGGFQRAAQCRQRPQQRQRFHHLIRDHSNGCAHPSWNKRENDPGTRGRSGPLSHHRQKGRHFPVS